MKNSLAITMKTTKNTQNNKTPLVSKVNKASPTRLRKMQGNKPNRNNWFQSWMPKIARAFDLDAVQGHSTLRDEPSGSDSKRSKEERASRMKEYGERASYAADAAMRQEGWQSFGFAQSKPARPKVSGGFTIIELLIATAVFSIVLMTALASFLQIGRLFYQGVSTTQTQTVVNQLFQDIVGNFQTAANISPAQSDGKPGGYTYYCIGNSRYTYNIGQRVILAGLPNHAQLASGGNFGLLKDVLPGATACATPCDDLGGSVCPAGAVPFKSPIEVLGDNMRLESFNLQQSPSVSPNFYNVSVVVAYGDDDLLNYTDPKDPSTVFCRGGSFNQQFCAVSRLDSGVYRGQGP